MAAWRIGDATDGMPSGAMALTRFSEAFGITRSSDDDGFDPHLTTDTKLFIDPLLLVLAGGSWVAAHDRLLTHLSYCYELVARSRGSDSVSARVARRLLTFPEPAEFGLGYTAAGVAGCRRILPPLSKSAWTAKGQEADLQAW